MLTIEYQAYRLGVMSGVNTDTPPAAISSSRASLSSEEAYWPPSHCVSVSYASSSSKRSPIGLAAFFAPEAAEAPPLFMADSCCSLLRRNGFKAMSSLTFSTMFALSMNYSSWNDKLLTLTTPRSTSSSPIHMIRGIPLSKAKSSCLAVLGLSVYRVSAQMPAYQSSPRIFIRSVVRFLPI